MFKKITQIFLIMIFLLTGVPLSASSLPTVNFSGFDWQVRNYYGSPGPNNWSAENVTVDSNGYLHLKIKKIADKWYSSSLHLDKSLGYGVYEYKLGSDINKQDFGTIVGLFLYQDDEHELDIELGKWTTSTKNNLHYSVQPYSVKGNSVGFPLVVNPSESSYVIDWQPQVIKFYAISEGRKMAEWEYKGANNFVPGKESVHINFWQIKGQTPSSGQDQELIVKSFKFTPLNSQSVALPALSSTVTPTTTIIKPVSTTIPTKEAKPVKKLTPAQIKAQQKLEKQKIEKRIAELKKELAKLQAQLRKMK